MSCPFPWSKRRKISKSWRARSGTGSGQVEGTPPYAGKTGWQVSGPSFFDGMKSKFQGGLHALDEWIGALRGGDASRISYHGGGCVTAQKVEWVRAQSFRALCEGPGRR